ncbi:TonB-dependent siderophore receptor [Novosphingobium sp. 18052]|uniref:TonB-dependent siderophore receptor n=2 Tax=unclassified Novosphingobium TaxID=2644732 RepID=UPI00190F71BA|nr:TonB-dependent siderophore receptor [Novosphingobium sp. 18052]
MSLTALMAGMATIIPAAANAQTESSQTETAILETTRQDDGAIIVSAPRFVPQGALTASKTNTPLIETPQSVSVVSRDQIDLLNFIDVQQAVRYTSGIVGENYGPDLRFDFLTLRGFIPVQYIDGLQAPVSSTISNVGVDLYGFEAVDILKGPSSVLYGTTPPGGIYNLTSRRPSDRTSGEFQVKYGTDDFKQAAGTFTGALAEGLTARVTGLYRDRDSQTDYVNARRAYVAPAVSAELGPDTRLTLLGYYQWDRVEGDTNGFLPAVGVLVDNPVGKVKRSINLGEPDYNFYQRRQWGMGYEFTHNFSSALKFTQNLRWGEYHEYQQIIYGASLGADNRTVTRNNFPFQDDTLQFTVDSRFDLNFATGPVEHHVLAGFDYRNYREASAFAFSSGGTIDLFDPVYSPGIYSAPSTLFASTDQRLKQKGAYVQDQARIGDFILTLSGRQDWIKIDNYAANAAIPVDKQDKFTWRAGATYVTQAGIAPYVSYATSFQPVVGQTLGGDAFKPTSGKQWEAGVKYDARSLGDNIKLFATAAVYRIEQSNVLTVDPANVLFQVQTGEVVSKGVELELVTRINQQLSINASYTYSDAKITQSNNPAELGARLAAQPKHKASIFVDYTHTSGIGAGAGVRYLSDSNGVVALPGSFITAGGVSLPSTFTSPSTTLFDATLHYDIPGWRFAVNGSNIFDKRYAGRCTGEVSCFFGQSRQIIGTVTKMF